MVARKSPRRKPDRRNPSARKYRDRQYEVSEWNVRAQRWEPLGRVTATTPKYAIEEFMASRPGYSRLHLRAEEIGATPRAKRRNPDRVLTVASVKAIGKGFGAKAAHELVRGQTVGDLEMDERVDVQGQTLLSVLLDDAEQYATAYLDAMDDGDVTLAIERSSNGKALWAAFSRGVASTARPVLAAFIKSGKVKLAKYDRR